MDRWAGLGRALYDVSPRLASLALWLVCAMYDTRKNEAD